MKLVFTKHATDYVAEAFGCSKKQFDLLCLSMNQYFKGKIEADNRPAESKSKLLEEFLNSTEFEETLFELKTPNDYFVLGYAFASVLETVKGKGDFLTSLLHSMLPPHEHEDKDEEEKMPN